LSDRPAVALAPDVAFESLQAAFEGAKTGHQPGGLSQSSFTLVGHTVRMRVVGRGLAGCVARPLAHLASPEAARQPPQLTIDLWDAEESGVPSPLGSTSEGLAENGAVTSSPDGRFLVHERPHSVVALDRRDQHVVGCVESSSRLQLGERARPLSLPLTVWSSDRDVHLIHAGLVAKDGHGVLLAGLGQAGKSTAALACACAGFDFLGDDCVALSLSARGEFEGHSLYNSTTLEAGHLARFPPLPSRASDGAGHRDEKSHVFLWEAPALHVTRVAPIRVLALPRIVGSCNSLPRPATKAEALLRLGPGSLVKRAVPPRACLSRMARLVDQVPSYWLDLDRELAEIPRRVQTSLAVAGLV
jgi:hypothetical protein